MSFIEEDEQDEKYNIMMNGLLSAIKCRIDERNQITRKTLRNLKAYK
jgi:hypothetical protein